MRSRDDRDALLGRTEELERETAQLRLENAELRARIGVERAELDVRGQVETTSRRAEVARLAARAPRPAAPRTQLPARGRFGLLVDESLSPTWSRTIWVLGFAALGPVMVALALGMDAALSLFGKRFSDHTAVLVLWLSLIVGYGFGVFVMRRRVTHIEARRERARLEALPIPLDIERYLGVLSTRRARKVLDVTIRFASGPSDQVRDTIVEAVRRGAGKLGDVRWSDDLLVIRSRVLKTRFTGPKGNTWHDNVRIHRWLRRLTRDVLIPLAHAYPMQQVQVD